ncbi:MAG: hypothetical protein K0V04_16620 [Deltaproteobacteria bacterium]|nr:hypothetical protein [Deltaproteobacteria bacterium]
MTAPGERPPAPLPRSTRALLAEFREAEGIPRDVEARIWAVVGAEDAPAPRLDDSPPPASPSSDRRTLGWVALGAAIAAAVLMAWRLGVTTLQPDAAQSPPNAASMRGAHDTADGRAHRTTVAPGRAAAGEVLAVEPEAPPPRAPAVTPSPSQPEPPSAASREPSHRPPTPSRGVTKPPASEEPTNAPSVTSTLAAERSMVARAWKALARGQTQVALDGAAEHARRFPAGLLAPERQAIDVIARCRRGDHDGASRARAFHRAHPRSPLAARIDDACRPSQ